MTKRSILWLFLLAFVSSCGTFSKYEPITYKVYTYEQPYDLVFLRTMETLDSNNDWVFSATRKELGVIEMRNTNYGNWFGVDRQYVRVLVKYVSEKETSVEIDPAHTSCKGKACTQLLEAVNEVLSALPPRPEKQTPPQDAEASEVSQPQAVQ